MLDQHSFETLFKSHFQGLCLFAVNYVKDMETAKEIVQDAYISLWEKRGSIDMSKPVKTYLTTIIRNKSINYLRDNKKFNNDIVELESLNLRNSHEHPEVMMGVELEKRIKNSIEELPEKCREIFLMNRFENLKYQEIADRLQLSVKTVESQMSKALQHMRTRLADYLYVILVIILLK